MSEEKKLNGTVIVTYRCNARCSMCNRYKAPSKPEEEISIETIKKLPKMYFTNITGGEPFIRTDLKDIVRELYKKSDRIVISTNGFFTDRIVDLCREFPDIGIRISIEGLEETNNKIRGLENGFQRGYSTLKQLVDMGYMRKTTGYYGDETKAAMKDFQSRNGLSADGLAGEKTYDMLYSPKAKESPKKAAQKKTKANISKMIEVARSKLGCKYILGNTGPKSFDCSGLVYYCLKQAGSNRRRLTAAGYSQVDDWEKISDINKLKKGDLICFYSDNYSKIGHIGIVISSSMMIDASSSNGKVVRREYKTTYWKKHFYCGRRPW